jgi:plastocyanin
MAFATVRGVSERSQIGRSARRNALLALAGAVLLLGIAVASTSASDSNVSIVFRAYQPAQLTVLAGQTVVWHNSGLGPHTVTSDTGAFDSGTLQAGGSFTYTFSTPGTYTYSCLIHPTMHGSVTALAALPPGFPPDEPLNAVVLRVSQKHTAHGGLTLVRAQAARPAAKALLQVQSRGGSWSTKLRDQLSSAGATTFKLPSSVHRRLRVVIQGPAGEASLISKPVRPPA